MLSIHRRLLLTLLSLFTTGWLVVLAMTYHVASRDLKALFDTQLAESAKVLMSLVDYGIDQNPDDINAILKDMGEGPFKKRIAFQVWKQGRVFLRSRNAPVFAKPIQLGYSTKMENGHVWRIFATDFTDTEDGDYYEILVGEPISLRNDLVYQITRDALYPLLLALPLLGILIWAGIGRGLQPLANVAHQVAQRSPANLEPVSIAVIPTEIRVLVHSLNALLERLRIALDIERRFTADAAHEMRTPLASLKTHAQVALRSTNAEQHRQALRQVSRSVDRITHLLEQILTLERLDRETADTVFTVLDFRRLTAEILAELMPEAMSKAIELSLEADAIAWVMGNPVALSVLLRNLVNNAIRYTPAGGCITVQVKHTGDRVQLTVIDSGPGIPLEERQRVFERFHRLQNCEVSGSGLGLSIVKRIVELHQARIELSDRGDGSGLKVCVDFSAIEPAC